MINYIVYKTMDVIIHPRPNLVNLCYYNGAPCRRPKTGTRAGEGHTREKCVPQKSISRMKKHRSFPMKYRQACALFCSVLFSYMFICTHICVLGGRFKNTYELLNLRALQFSYVNKIHIFQCMGTIFCVAFQRYPLKFHTKYLTHTLKYMIFMQFWNFKSS